MQEKESGLGLKKEFSVRCDFTLADLGSRAGTSRGRSSSSLCVRRSSSPVLPPRTPSSAGEPAASPLRAVLRKWANACAPAFVQWRARVKEEKWCETQTHELLDEVEQLETEMAEIQAYFRARGSPVQ